MSVVLNPAEMLAALEAKNEPRAALLRARLEAVTNELGELLAAHAGAAVWPCVYDPNANLGCVFLPLYRRQPFPEEFASWSDGDEEEWCGDAEETSLPIHFAHLASAPVEDDDALDGKDLRDTIALLKRVGTAEAQEAVNGLRCQYCTSCGRISEDCSDDPCDAVKRQRNELGIDIEEA
jgi:hypothetical protein